LKKKRIFIVPIWQQAKTQLECESGPTGLFYPLPLFSIFRAAQPEFTLESAQPAYATITMHSPTEAHQGETALMPLLHRLPDHGATRTTLTMLLTRDLIAPTLRAQRRSEPSRTPPRTARIGTETASRNPFCKIRTNFVDLELELKIESALNPNSLRQTLPPINRSFTRRRCHPNHSCHSHLSLCCCPAESRPHESTRRWKEGPLSSPPSSEPELHRKLPPSSARTDRAASPSTASRDLFPLL
jgi:hypothetical protein